MAILVNSTTPVSDKNKWATRWECYHDAEYLFRRDTGKSLVLDVAAEPQTTKLDRYYVSPDWITEQNGNFTEALTQKHSYGVLLAPQLVGFDGLQCEWEDGWWCNPPFDLKQPFIKKAVEEMFKGHDGMMLLPYEPLTGWWLDLVEGYASMIYEPDGRYSFYEADGHTLKRGVNFGSVLVLFSRKALNTPRSRFKRNVSTLNGV